MAKTSVIEREEKRAKLIKKYAAKRKELKETIRKAMANAKLPEAERWQIIDEATAKLQALPRNANPTRKRNRCRITGRPRGVYKKFGLARSMLRIHAMRGDIPGLVKASW